MKRDRTTSRPVPARAAEWVADLPAFLSVATAARETGLGESTLRRYAAEGRLRVIPTAAGSGGGGRVLIPRSELARFLADLDENGGR